MEDSRGRAHSKSSGSTCIGFLWIRNVKDSTIKVRTSKASMTCIASIGKLHVNQFSEFTFFFYQSSLLGGIADATSDRGKTSKKSGEINNSDLRVRDGRTQSAPQHYIRSTITITSPLYSKETKCNTSSSLDSSSCGVLAQASSEEVACIHTICHKKSTRIIPMNTMRFIRHDRSTFLCKSYNV
ncbi:unnamed protein product [Albugo candida]|uniref:Uncharacterized protein n=1 Tax=Albugo candida TaxID=65357 RepID=A0A024FVU6_9STRA|nr:unnamed protein product [Albugo candida]|eukprot:CCI10997.1 unnamed protein product [Albugo candida]